MFGATLIMYDGCEFVSCPYRGGFEALFERERDVGLEGVKFRVNGGKVSKFRQHSLCQPYSILA